MPNSDRSSNTPAHAPSAAGSPPRGRLHGLLRRVVSIEPQEMRAVGWAWLYFFSVLSSYYVIRPIRDEMGVAGGVSNLPWLFTGTMLAMMLANPPFAALVSRLPRARFVSLAYRFFAANLVVFFLLLQAGTDAQNIWLGRIFYIWAAVFNLFVVSVFWSVMTDVFSRAQGLRLFGFISAGGTLGGIAGSSLTAALVDKIGPTALLLVSVALLEAACLSVRRLSRISDGLREDRPPADSSAMPSTAAAAGPEQVIGGGAISGIAHAFSSAYLLNISAFMLLYTILSTFLYFQQASIVETTMSDRATRTAFFARVDLLVNLLTLGAQLFLTSRVLKIFGLTLALATLPLMSAFGFLTLGLWPTVTAIVAFQTLRRAGNFAITQPSRQVLFTVLSREDRYKAKNFIETFVYRAGDQIGAWSYALMGWFSLGISGTALVAVPISLVWLVNSIWLGRQQEKFLTQSPAPASPPAQPNPLTTAC